MSIRDMWRNRPSECRRRREEQARVLASRGLSEFDVTELARYNGDRHRGVVFDSRTEARMRDLQSRYDGKRERDVPDRYQAALFEGERQVTDWVTGPPCAFGTVRPGPDRYKVRIPDGRVYAGPLPMRPTGGTYTLEGPFRWAPDSTIFPGDIVRES